MSVFQPGWASIVAAAAGAVGWLAINIATGRREAWDSEAYFLWFLPAIALLVAALAFFAPERSWRWAFLPFGAQAVVAFVQDPTAGLLPMGLVAFALFGAICLIPARVGASVRRRLSSR